MQREQTLDSEQHSVNTFKMVSISRCFYEKPQKYLLFPPNIKTFTTRRSTIYIYPEFFITFEAFEIE